MYSGRIYACNGSGFLYALIRCCLILLTVLSINIDPFIYATKGSIELFFLPYIQEWGEEEEEEEEPV